MRPLSSLSSVLLAVACIGLPTAQAEKKTFEGGRYSLEFPEDWEKGEGFEDGHQLWYDAPDGNGSFSTYVVLTGKDKRADLSATLKKRVEQLSEAGLKIEGDVQGQEQEFDGKKAIFATVPAAAEVQGSKVRFTFFLVFLDAKDQVVIMQAMLRRPAGDKLREDALSIIQSFRESEEEEKKD